MHGNEVLVSIITPAFNCKNTIRFTYDSILKQTFTNWEWIIVEDHSLDNSFNFIRDMVKDNPKVLLLRTDKNSGTARARNKGIEEANGRFITFLDADDFWKQNKFECQINFMINNNLVFTYSNYEVMRDDGKTSLFRPKKQSLRYKDLLVSNDIGCLTAAYDAKIIGKHYMPLDSPKREDFAAWLDILKTGIIARRIDETLAVYRLGNTTLTSNKTKMVKYHYNVYRKHEHFGILKSIFYLCSFVLRKLFTKY